MKFMFSRKCKFYSAMAIFYSKWPPKHKNTPISMKFGFQVHIGVASSFLVSKFYPAVAILNSKWLPETKNAQISMKFGF